MAGDLEAPKRAILKAQLEMGIDDELFGFILFDCADVDDLEKADMNGLKTIIGALDGLGRQSGAKVSQAERYNIRLMGIRDLKRELSRLGLGVQGTGNALAKSLFGIESYQWCRMDQIGQMVSILRKRAKEKAS